METHYHVNDYDWFLEKKNGLSNIQGLAWYRYFHRGFCIEQVEPEDFQMSLDFILITYYEWPPAFLTRYCQMQVLRHGYIEKTFQILWIYLSDRNGILQIWLHVDAIFGLLEIEVKLISLT